MYSDFIKKNLHGESLNNINYIVNFINIIILFIPFHNMNQHRKRN